MAFVPLKTLLKAKQDDFRKQNLEASSDRCSALLQNIFGSLEEDVKQGIYSKPGGHCLFMQETEKLKAKYYQEPRKGIQVSLVTCINCIGGWEGGFFQNPVKRRIKYLCSDDSWGIKLNYHHSHQTFTAMVNIHCNIGTFLIT